jgi:hypothetical protein
MPLSLDAEYRQPLSQLNDMGTSKRLKETYEYAPKGYLTSAPGSVNQTPDFKSMTKREFRGIREFDLEH